MSMSRSFAQVEWKPEESAGNGTQRGLPLIGEVSKPQEVPLAVIAKATFSGCLIEAIRHCGKEDQTLAAEIHISTGYMSKFIRSVGANWAKRIVLFMRVTNSIAPLQWIADQVGCDVTIRHAITTELAIARARVAELERAGKAFA